MVSFSSQGVGERQGRVHTDEEEQREIPRGRESRVHEGDGRGEKQTEQGEEGEIK